jgi:type III secretion protein Q
MDPTSPDDTLVTHQQDEPIAVSELDVPVQLEIDTVALTVSQLSAMRPGYVLGLPTLAADAQVKLIAHGQTIGHGELVMVGEQLGVRIIRMAHGDDPA